MKMKKITNPKWMKLLKVLHLLGMILLCVGLLGAKVLLLQPDPDLPTVALLGANFTRNGGILLLGTGLIYNLFTRYPHDDQRCNIDGECGDWLHQNHHF